MAQTRSGRSDPGSPPQLNDGWKTGTPIDAGIVPDSLQRLLEEIRVGTFRDVHSVLIARGGRLVFEKYFPGYAWDWEGEAFRGPWVAFGPDSLHYGASVTKSVTGLLVGIAIDQGCLPGLNASVFSFFPEHAGLSDEGKSGITLAHLLTMTSGLEWNEHDVFYDNLGNDIVQLSIVDDPVAYVLSKSLVDPPASTFYYNGGGPDLLGEIIRRCSGKKLDDYAREHLFFPLGIHSLEWNRLSSGTVDAAGGIKLRPRDMAKLGQLVLNKGNWSGTQIVSESWIAMMTRRWVPLGPIDGYGFLWRTTAYEVGSETVNAVYADGWGGRRIMVSPSLDLLIVFTGGNYTEQHRLDEAVSRLILPALTEPD